MRPSRSMKDWLAWLHAMPDSLTTSLNPALLNRFGARGHGTDVALRFSCGTSTFRPPNKADIMPRLASSWALQNCWRKEDSHCTGLNSMACKAEEWKAKHPCVQCSPAPPSVDTHVHDPDSILPRPLHSTLRAGHVSLGAILGYFALEVKALEGPGWSLAASNPSSGPPPGVPAQHRPPRPRRYCAR